MTAPLPLPDLSGLEHAQGPAVDTPAHLAALTGADPAARTAATEHLDEAVIPGGEPSSIAGATAVFVAGLLASDQITDTATKIEALYFLGQVADAAPTPIDGEPGAELDTAEAAAVRECRAALPAILRAAEHAEHDADEEVRVEAADTAEAVLEAQDSLG